MDAFQMGELFWILALTVPVLVVLLALCVDCRDPELDTPPIGDYEEKPPTTVRPQTFRVLRRPPSPSFSSNHSLPDLKSLPNQSLSFFQAEGDDESVPSYENQEQVCITDDEENYFPGYIVVLPDVPIVDQRNEDHASTDSVVDQYENMPESERHSPGDYVNVLEPEATILDPCFDVLLLQSDASHLPERGSSDQESEEDTPDYENVCSGV
ncbi:linker for activation of T-cells family member 1 isoform X3 [Pogona vitticeps]|uniref:Linker for activation of T-cells family member 1 isoform X3 n=1 Tax=Pogona vitticeps TaxID=103695 RepID=A0ABM5GSL1_9SAUR